MKNNITRGEWNAKDGQIYSLQTGKTLALIPYWDNEPEQEANAQLIAQAPAMLAALEDVLRILNLDPTHDNNYQRNKIQHLIKKAKGE